MKSLSCVVSFVLICFSVVAHGGCGKEEERKPLSREEIFAERIKIPTLFLTEDGRELIAPGNEQGVIVNPEAGTLAWAAWQCDNPDCPGQGQGGRPFLFTRPVPFVSVGDDGKPEFGYPTNAEEGAQYDEASEPVCPACLSLRDRKSESDEERQQYVQWCTPYVLPEAEKRLEELEDAYQDYLERVESYRAREQ